MLIYTIGISEVTNHKFAYSFAPTIVLGLMLVYLYPYIVRNYEYMYSYFVERQGSRSSAFGGIREYICSDRRSNRSLRLFPLLVAYTCFDIENSVPRFSFIARVFSRVILILIDLVSIIQKFFNVLSSLLCALPDFQCNIQ